MLSFMGPPGFEPGSTRGLGPIGAQAAHPAKLDYGPNTLFGKPLFLSSLLFYPRDELRVKY